MWASQKVRTLTVLLFIGSWYSGDDIILRCHHSTMGQALPIFGGVASYDELCFAVLTHFCPEDQYCPHNTMTSCMSRPTDENLANAFGFSLNYYETQYYEELRPPSKNKRFVLITYYETQYY